MTTSSTSFQKDMLVKSLLSLCGKLLLPQLVRRSICLSHHILSLTMNMTPTRRTETPIKKMMKMLRKYHRVAKMPKGWAHVAEGNGKEEVDKVWEMQKRALF